MQTKPPTLARRTPLSVRIYEDLAASIHEKKLLPGGRLPTMAEVADQYGVSLRTAAIAFERLKAEGLVVSRTASGTFVAHPVEAATSVEIILCVNPKLLNNLEGPRTWYPFARLSGVIAGAERRHMRLAPLTDGALFTSFIHADVRQGLILMDDSYEPDGFGDMARYATEHKWPVCMVTGPSKSLLCVEDNRGKGFELATNHLLSLGHRRIAYINLSPEGWTPMAVERLIVGPRSGYFRALKRAGVRPEPGLYMELPAPETVGPGPTAEAVERLLALDSRPTAILASNDNRAVVVLQVLKAHGVRVPQEMSVIGCDDVSASERSVPRLTTINTELMAQGEAAVNYIVNCLQGQKAPLPSVMPRLVVRASSGVPPSGSVSEGRGFVARAR